MLSVFNVVIILEKNLKNKISFKSSSTRLRSKLPMMMSHIHQQVEMSRWVRRNSWNTAVGSRWRYSYCHGNWLILCFFYSKINELILTRFPNYK